MGAVLAFIGKVLLIILCILLFLILLVGLILFVPIRYKAYIEKHEDIEVKLRASWLLSIIHVAFVYTDGEPRYKIRLFGIDLIKAAGLFRRKKKKNDSIEHKEDNRRKVYDEDTYEKNNGEIYRKGTYEKSLDRGDEKLSEKEILKREVADKKDLEKEDIEEDYNNDSTEGRKKGIRYKLEEIVLFIRKCIDTLKEAKDKLSELKDKAIDIKNKISIIKEFIFSEYVKGIICIVRGNVLKLLKKLKPRKLKSDIVFGMGDPCLTGEILGGIAVFMAVTGMMINVTPDFERQILEGRLEVAGKIRIFALIRIALGIIMSKEWKSFYKEAMRIKEEL